MNRFLLPAKIGKWSGLDEVIRQSYNYQLNGLVRVTLCAAFAKHFALHPSSPFNLLLVVKDERGEVESEAYAKTVS